MSYPSRYLVAVVVLLTLTVASRSADLFEAMNQGDAAGIAKMLKADPKLVSKPNANGDLPLHYALRGNNFKIVTLLVEAGADVNAFDGNGFTAMNYAASNKNKAVIELLIAKGAKIDVPNKHAGMTPLFYAARAGHKPIVALLLEKGARIDGGFDPAKLDPPWTPLYEAVSSGRLATAEFLLAKDANPNAKGLLHGGPLDKAAENRDLDMIRLLLANGADVHSESAFLQALQSGQRDLVELFLKRGIDAKKPEYLSTAAGVNKEMVELMLDRGANPRNVGTRGISSLAAAAQKGDAAVLALLLARGADVKHYDDQQMTALHYAANAIVAELLLASGADANAETKDGTTPMLFALNRGRKDVAESLAKRGAKLDVFSMAALGRADDLRKHLQTNPIPKPAHEYHVSALHLAAMFGQNDTTGVLLDKGADINSKTWDGRTPLHLAAQNGHKATVEFLLKKGADLDAKTSKQTFTQRGWTPLQLALDAGHVEVVRLLVAKGATPKLEGDTAKQWWRHAGERKQLPLLRYFVEQGVATKAESLATPLQLAAEQGDLEFVKYLVVKGADVKNRDPSANSALRAAAHGNQKAVVEFLLAMGADANERDALAEAIRMGHKDIVELLLSKGATLDQPGDLDVGGLLREAVVADRLDMVKLLLAKGADPKKDERLLHYAALQGRKPIVETLLAAGADVNATAMQGFHLYYWHFQKWPEVLDFFQKPDATKPPPETLNDVQAGTPLHAAVAGKHKDVVELLLAKGAKIVATLPNGSPVLHLAAYLGDVETAKVLLANKANLDAKDAMGLTALQLAEREGRKEMGVFLRKQGTKD